MMSRKSAGKSTSRKSTSKSAGKTAKKKARPAGRIGAAASRKKASAGRKVARKKTPSRPAAVRKAARKPAPRAPRPAAPRPEPPQNPLGIYELHVGFNTRRLDDVTGFFRDMLGLKGEAMPEMRFFNVMPHRGASIGFMDWDATAEMARQRGEPEPGIESTSLYFLCQDVEKVYRDLSARGTDFEGPPEDMPWNHRVIRTRDPEGRSVAFAQVLGRG